MLPIADEIQVKMLWIKTETEHLSCTSSFFYIEIKENTAMKKLSISSKFVNN